MSTIGTVHAFNAFGGHRTIHLTTGSLFNSNVIESLSYFALRYRRNTVGEDAMLFAGHLAVFEYNEPTPL
ncbi:hypothetical protein PQR21_14925 [Paraburkholderia nemoris]|uniref:hypothetical protein n=1 Tax=Paraburkholderia nemoris TaxID=2793076 RepID=UPI0038B98941